MQSNVIISVITIVIYVLCNAVEGNIIDKKTVMSFYNWCVCGENVKKCVVAKQFKKKKVCNSETTRLNQKIGKAGCLTAIAITHNLLKQYLIVVQV